MNAYAYCRKGVGVVGWAIKMDVCGKPMVNQTKKGPVKEQPRSTAGQKVLDLPKLFQRLFFEICREPALKINLLSII